MIYRRRLSVKRPSKKPADAASGVLFLRQFMLKLYDREDGKAADWPLIAETLLREAFHAIDQTPAEPRAPKVCYDRFIPNPTIAWRETRPRSTRRSARQIVHRSARRA